MTLYGSHKNYALFLIESGLTLSGVIAAITPLALWVSWSELVFYTVLSVGCCSFLLFIGLAHLRGYLVSDYGSSGKVLDFESLQKRRVDWENLQESNVVNTGREIDQKGSARREFSFMVRIVFMLILFVAILFLLVWGIMELQYN